MTYNTKETVNATKNVIWIAFKHINKRNIGVGSRAHADG